MNRINLKKLDAAELNELHKLYEDNKEEIISDINRIYEKVQYARNNPSVKVTINSTKFPFIIPLIILIKVLGTDINQVIGNPKKDNK